MPTVYDVALQVPSKQSAAANAGDDITVRIRSDQVDVMSTDAVRIVLAASFAVSMGRKLVDDAAVEVRRYLAAAAAGQALTAADTALRKVADQYFLVRKDDAKYTKSNTDKQSRSLTARADADDWPDVQVFDTVRQKLEHLALRLAHPITLKMYGQHFNRPDSKVAPEGHTQGYVKKQFADKKSPFASPERIEGRNIHLNFNAFANELSNEHNTRQGRESMVRTFIHEATHKFFFTQDVFYIQQGGADKHVFSKGKMEVGSDQVGRVEKKVLNSRMAVQNADSFAYFIVSATPLGLGDTPWISDKKVDAALKDCIAWLKAQDGLPAKHGDPRDAKFGEYGAKVDVATPRWNT